MEVSAKVAAKHADKHTTASQIGRIVLDTMFEDGSMSSVADVQVNAPEDCSLFA